MCTVTWTRGLNGYHLFMNRDELHSRGSAHPPSIDERDGIAFIAPIDSDGGGTWMGVNEYGITVCLLNHYPDFGEPLVRQPGQAASRLDSNIANAASTESRRIRTGDHRSRGLLVVSLLKVRSCGGVSAALGMMDLGRYRPFLVLALGRSCGPTLHRWDGSELLVLRDPAPPISTSSFDTRAVVRRRMTTFDERVLGGDTAITADMPGVEPDSLRAYHAGHHPEKGPYSVCTHRGDGATKSLSHVSVGAENVEFRYAPGPPCETALETAGRLDLRTGRRGEG